MTRDDRQGLERLSKRSWLYLALAASVPLLSIAILALIGSRARYALAVLSVGGVAGLATAFFLFRTLQADLAALAFVAAPTEDRRKGF